MPPLHSNRLKSLLALRSKVHGFTVGELLLTIGILAVLIALAYGGYRRAVDGGQSASCISQLRQIYTGLVLYAQENRGMLPPATEPNSRSYTWDVAWTGPWCAPRTLPEKGFPAYIAGGVETARKLAICPTNRKDTPNYWLPTHFRHYYLCNYDLMTSSGFPDPPARLADIQLQNTVLLLEAATGSAWQSVGIPSRAFGAETWKRIGSPHSKRLNVLWADGHITNLKVDELQREDFVRKPR